jgi:hypothetical protein
MDASRDLPILLPYQFLVAVLAVTCAELLVLDQSLLRNGLAARAATLGIGTVGNLLAGVGVIAAASYVTRLLGRRGKLRALTDRAEQAIRAVEDRLYWMRTKQRR